MYYQYFGLNEPPFSIAVNPRYLFMSARHRDALAHLLYGVGAGGGFILLTGEVGTGKTTINRCLLEQLPHDTDIAIILNPALNAMELLASACDEFGIDYDPDNHSLKTLTDNLHSYLLENHRRGRKSVLLIDEAQHLDFDVLEQIRLLTNLETNSEKLLQIILIGQPELSQMLARPELRQLNQRITARYNLEPLNLDETGAYIHHRLQVAGMSPERVIFPASVVRGIYRATRGIPRVINVLCDRILLGAYGRNKSRADRSMLNVAVREVLGREPAKQFPWRWLAGFAVLVLVLAGGWYLLRGWPGPSTWAVQSPAAISPSKMPPIPAPVETQRMPSALPANVTAQEESTVEDGGAIDDVHAVTPVPEDTVAELPSAVEDTTAPLMVPGSEALLPPEDATAWLWSLYSDGPAPVNTCPRNVESGIACIRGEAKTWNELLAFDRPLLLQMITPQRFSAATLMLGIQDDFAWVLTAAGVARVSLAELAPLWSGQYAYLWHPPVGLEGPLALGDRSKVVAAVARSFATLDSQPEPLTDTLFNRRLEQRVRIFQDENGLTPDGVVGLQTLAKLNEHLGIDVTAGQARQQLDSRLTGVQVQ